MMIVPFESGLDGPLAAARASTRLLEFIRQYPGPPENGPQGALGDVAGVVGDGGVPIRFRMDQIS